VLIYENDYGEFGTIDGEKHGDVYEREEDWSVLLEENLKRHFKGVAGYNMYKDPTLSVLRLERYDPFNFQQRDSSKALKIYNRLNKDITDVGPEPDDCYLSRHRVIRHTYLKVLRKLLI
jgi:hypothetical protein